MPKRLKILRVVGNVAACEYVKEESQTKSHHERMVLNTLHNRGASKHAQRNSVLPQDKDLQEKATRDLPFGFVWVADTRYQPRSLNYEINKGKYKHCRKEETVLVLISTLSIIFKA